MPGESDPLYDKAREVLLDALQALGPQRPSLILVGAQAIYAHTGDADIAVAPYTTDADLVIDPAELLDQPHLAEALQSGGFVAGVQPGEWLKDDVRVDLMVPDAVAGVGRRGVRLGVHGKRAARRARGLEGALVDHDAREIASFREGGRREQILVAGPAALLVSKLHKLAERLDDQGRLKDKDALDVLRLLRGVPMTTLVAGMPRLIGDVRSQEVVREAIGHLRHLFGRADSPGSGLAARAAEGLEPEDTVRESCSALAQELLAAL